MGFIFASALATRWMIDEAVSTATLGSIPPAEISKAEAHSIGVDAYLYFYPPAILDGVFDGILRRSLWAFEKYRQAKRSL